MAKCRRRREKTESLQIMYYVGILSGKASTATPAHLTKSSFFGGDLKAVILANVCIASSLPVNSTEALQLLRYSINLVIDEAVCHSLDSFAVHSINPCHHFREGEASPISEQLQRQPAGRGEAKVEANQGRTTLVPQKPP